MNDLEQFKQTFFQECDELLSGLELQLTSLKEGSSDMELLHGAFRALHSIKGGAGAFGFDRLVSFAHVFETLLDLMRDGKVALGEELFALSLRAGDVLADLVDSAQSSDDLPADHEGQIAAELAAAANMEAPEAPEAEAAASDQDAVSLGKFEIEFRPKPEMLRFANEPLLIIRQLKELGSVSVTADVSALPALADMEPADAYIAWVFELETSGDIAAIEEVFEFVEDDCDLTIRPIPGVEEDAAQSPELIEAKEDEQKVGAAQNIAAANAPAAPTKKAPAVSSIRVELDRIDRLVNMVGEIVIGQAMVAQQIDDTLAQSNPRLVHELGQLFQHTQSLQDRVMAIRAQPVQSIFARMPRLVRDLAAQTDKKVRMEMSGEATEIDKTVIEQLADPLTHMIRNSVDHGIEPSEEREALGKPLEGVIRLSAEQRGNRIVIEIADDGRGINREKVLEKAIEKGLVAEDANPSDEEIDNLILMPGFSTAESVSDLSGRGVGMDVVKQNIQTLGGRISIRSKQGHGSTIALTLPLTLAVLDGMIVRVGGESYIIPMANIVESFAPQKADLHDLPGSGEVLKFRDDYVKRINLEQIFGVTSGSESSSALVILVEAEGGHLIGLAIDEILGQQQVVIKSLEENFEEVPGIAGATILGDGKVALILDVTAIQGLQKSQMPGLRKQPTTETNLQECVA